MKDFLIKHMPVNNAVVPTALTIFFCLIAATILAVQLFKHPIVSIADNTDFRRLSAQVGIFPEYPYPEGFFKYAHLHFLVGHGEHINYASTELIFCKIARIINVRFFNKEIFDVRFLGLTHAAFYCLALFVFASTIRMPFASALVFLSLCLFVLLDDRVTSYFNSFYSEGSSVIYLLMTLDAMLLLGAENPSVSRRRASLLVFFLTSFLLAFSKIQNLVMLLPLWIFVCIVFRNMYSDASRWGLAILSGVLMIGAIWYGVASDAYAFSKDRHIKMVLTLEFKKYSQNIDKDLHEMHATRKDISKVTFGRIALFYAKHPKRYWELLNRRAAETFQSLPYGSYTQNESHWPWEQSAKFSMWWDFKAKHYPKQLWFIGGILGTAFLLGAHKYIRSGSPWQSHMGLITATLAVMAAGAFIVASTFEAEGMEKNFFIFNILFDFATLFAAFGAYASIRGCGLTVALRHE